MAKRYRVAAEFDVVVRDGNEEAANQFAERFAGAWLSEQEQNGARIETTGGSPEVVVRAMLDSPAHLGSLLTIATLNQGTHQTPVEIENINVKPLTQTED